MRGTTSECPDAVAVGEHALAALTALRDDARARSGSTALHVDRLDKRITDVAENQTQRADALCGRLATLERDREQGRGVSVLHVARAANSAKLEAARAHTRLNVAAEKFRGQERRLHEHEHATQSGFDSARRDFNALRADLDALKKRVKEDHYQRTYGGAEPTASLKANAARARLDVNLQAEFRAEAAATRAEKAAAMATQEANRAAEVFVFPHGPRVPNRAPCTCGWSGPGSHEQGCGNLNLFMHHAKLLGRDDLNLYQLRAAAHGVALPPVTGHSHEFKCKRPGVVSRVLDYLGENVNELLLVTVSAAAGMILGAALMARFAS